MPLEKSFKRTCVSIENWLISVIFGLLWLVGSPKGLLCAYLITQRPLICNIFWQDTIWELGWLFGVKKAYSSIQIRPKMNITSQYFIETQVF